MPNARAMRWMISAYACWLLQGAGLYRALQALAGAQAALQEPVRALSRKANAWRAQGPSGRTNSQDRPVAHRVQPDLTGEALLSEAMGP